MKNLFFLFSEMDWILVPFQSLPHCRVIALNVIIIVRLNIKQFGKKQADNNWIDSLVCLHLCIQDRDTHTHGLFLPFLLLALFTLHNNMLTHNKR